MATAARPQAADRAAAQVSQAVAELQGLQAVAQLQATPRAAAALPTAGVAVAAVAALQLAALRREGAVTVAREALRVARRHRRSP